MMYGLQPAITIWDPFQNSVMPGQSSGEHYIGFSSVPMSANEVREGYVS